MGGEVRRTVLLVCTGVLLFSVPTVFTMFPGLTRNSRDLRYVILLAWFVAAAAVAVTSTRLDEQLSGLARREAGVRRDERFLAGSKAIKLVLTNPPQELRAYEFRLYLYDEDADQLVSSFDAHLPIRSAPWFPGIGATGRAYELNEYQCARDEQVWDATFGLTPEQQEYHRRAGTKVVAAMPLRNFRKECIGVLTGSSKTDETMYLLGVQGVDQHIELASIVQRLVIDVLREASD